MTAMAVTATPAGDWIQGEYSVADENVGTTPAADAAPANEAADNTPFEGNAEGDPEASPAGEGNDAADAGEQEAAPADEPSTAATPPAAVLSPALVHRAARAGLEEADIAGCQSDAELQWKLDFALRRAPQTDSGGQKPADAPKLEDIPELADLEQYGEPLVKGWKAMRGHILALRAQLEGEQKTRQIAETNAQFEWFDSQLGALEHGADIFGSGSGNELKPGKELENREKLWNAMATIRRGYAGRAAPSKSAMLKQAHQMVFAGEVERLKQAKLGEHLAQRKGQFVHPPTQRAAGETLKGDAKAISSVQKRLDAKKKR